MRTGLALLEERITLKQGAGGRAMRALIEDIFLQDAPEMSALDVGPRAMDDGAALWIGDRWLVVTTDSHVVHPPFFPGGDIGRLAFSRRAFRERSSSASRPRLRMPAARPAPAS